MSRMQQAGPSPFLPLPRPPNPEHQVVLGLGHVGVIRPKACGIDFQCPAVIVFHLLRFALVLAQQGQVAQLLGHVWMKLAQDLGQEWEPWLGPGPASASLAPGPAGPARSHLFPDFQRPLAQRLSFFVLAPFAVQNRQVV